MSSVTRNILILLLTVTLASFDAIAGQEGKQTNNPGPDAPSIGDSNSLGGTPALRAPVEGKAGARHHEGKPNIIHFIIDELGYYETSHTRNARQNTPAEIVDGIRAICVRIRAKLPETKIILMAVFPREKESGHPRRKLIDETNRLLAAEFSHVPGITLMDIGPKFLTPDGTLDHDLLPDFCHPNKQGYQIWADALHPLVKGL